MKRLWKRVIGVMLTFTMMAMLFAGCAGDKDGKPSPAPTGGQKERLDIAVGALKGATALGMLSLMENDEKGTTANNYEFTVAGTADELTTGLVKGDIPIAAIPCNLASVLYNKSKGGVTMLAINTLGVLYVVESGDTIHSVADLAGKTIYSTGKGTTPEYTLNQLLKAAGLDPQKDVTIEFKSESAEVASLLSQSENAIAMLPQPYVTTVMMNNDKVRIALDVAKEWEAMQEGSTVVTGVLVANTKFLNENPEAVKAFLDEYRLSTAYANEKVTETAALAERFGIFKAAVAEKAIPYCNIVIMTGEEMKEKAEAYLQVLFDQNPAAIGGAMPEAEFFYQ